MLTDRWIESLLTQKPLAQLAAFASRLLMALIFLLAGWGKVTGYAGTAHYMQAMGVPPSLLPLTIAVEACCSCSASGRAASPPCSPASR